MAQKKIYGGKEPEGVWEEKSANNLFQNQAEIGPKTKSLPHRK